MAEREREGLGVSSHDLSRSLLSRIDPWDPGHIRVIALTSRFSRCSVSVKRKRASDHLRATGHAHGPFALTDAKACRPRINAKTLNILKTTNNKNKNTLINLRVCTLSPHGVTSTVIHVRTSGEYFLKKGGQAKRSLGPRGSPLPESLNSHVSLPVSSL